MHWYCLVDSGQCYWWAGQAARRLSFRALPLGSNTGSGDNRSGRQHMNQALRSDALRISSSYKGSNVHTSPLWNSLWYTKLLDEMRKKQINIFFQPKLKMAIIVILGNMISNSETRLQEEFGGVERSSSGSSTRAVDKDGWFCFQPFCWCFMKWVYCEFYVF